MEEKNKSVEAHIEEKNLDGAQPFFCENNISDNTKNGSGQHHKKKINKNYVLDKIRELAPLSIYDLKKELGFGYSTIWGIVREFEFCGLIKLKSNINEKNREVKTIEVVGK